MTLALTGDDPVYMLTAPIPATKKALKRAGLSIDDIDVIEINEAFAPVPMAWLKELGADPARTNPNGGAIALGHPLGGTGAILMTKLLHELERTGGRYGLQTMCEGGGQANVTIIERPCRGRRRIADDQPGGHAVHTRRGLSADRGEQVLGGGVAEALQVGVDRGEGRPGLLRQHLPVVVADDRDVVGHPPAALPGGLDEPGGDLVVAAEHRVDRGLVEQEHVGREPSPAL